jgi:DNA replication protein DnaC
MLTHPTYDRLVGLGLTGMAKALDEQRNQRNVDGLSFEERLGLLVDREAAERETKRLVTRLKSANLRQSAVIEDLDTKAARGLDKALFAKLASGEWIARRQDLLITGKTGTGKSWLACALGHKACRDDRAVLYWRVPRLLDALALARGDGRFPRLLRTLARVDLLILDDWGLAPLTSQQGRDLLEIIDDRHGRGSTIVTSQVPVKHWHELLADPTIADAILDRLVHTAHRIALTGDTLRDPQRSTAKRGKLDTTGDE